MTIEVKEIKVVTRNPHPRQAEFLDSKAKRKIIRAGRRSGKTVGISIGAVDRFIEGRRVLYTAPTGEQTDRFWFEITRALQPLIDTKVYKRDETERYIEKIGTLNRIKAKTAWNANTLRGDYADYLIFDEWQLTAEDAWDDIGAPMLIDNSGDAVFIYTPPSLKSSSISRASDPRHASKMFKMAQQDKTGRWAAFHFTSHDNPHLSDAGLMEITQDMSRDSYLKEIMAEDDEEQADVLVYGCFNETACKIERFEIPSNWFVYTGHDFGSANPAALFIAQDPSTGFFYCFKEYVPSTGKSTYQNVQEFKKLSILPGHGAEETPPLYNILQRVGGNQTTEEEIRQGYATQGWPINAPYITQVKTQIDRVKQLMEKNKIFIFSDMYRLLEEINTCMWKLDEFGKRTNEIKDEKRYHLLACFVAGTMIKMEKGEVPIENVKAGDRVLTREGYQKVVVSEKTGIDREVMTAIFSDGSTLTATPDHPVYVKEKGWMPLTCLRYGDTMETWKGKRSFTKGRSITGILNRRDGVTGFTLSLQRGISIVSCGKMLMVKYLKAAPFIIKMMIHYIMSYLTLSAKATENICQTIWRIMIGHANNSIILPEYGLLPELVIAGGQVAKMARVTSKKDYGARQNIIQRLASTVGKNIKQETYLSANIAPMPVNQPIADTTILMMKQEPVPFVESNTSPINTPEAKHVQSNVVCLGVKPAGKTTVYNLSVDSVPEYFANGILVHNCLRYVCSVFKPETERADKSEPIPVYQPGQGFHKSEKYDTIPVR